MKNCGEYVRFEVAEQHVLQEMVKIIQKKVCTILLYFCVSRKIPMYHNFFKKRAPVID
jgi:hypothetical protein